MAPKKPGTLAVAVLESLLLVSALGGAAHADDRDRLHYLGGSVYVDDSGLLGSGLLGSGLLAEVDDNNVLDAACVSGYTYNKDFWNFPGGPADTSGNDFDKTYLGFDAILEDSRTGQPISNTRVTLIGAGLPTQTRTDRSGRLIASSTSPANEIRVVLQVTGYYSYSIITFRERVGNFYFANVEPTLSLTPIVPLPPARSGMKSQAD